MLRYRWMCVSCFPSYSGGFYLDFFAGSWRRWSRGWEDLREITEKSERFLWGVYDRWRWKNGWVWGVEGQDWPWNCLWETLEVIYDPFLSVISHLEGLGEWFWNLSRDSPVLGRSSREGS